MNILLVRSGRKYHWRYQTALIKQILALNEGHVIYCLTDQDDSPGRCVPLQKGWPGWWAKLELFAPYNKKLRPALYIDLDSFVLGPIAQYEMEEFTMVEDFTGHVPANSSVMWLPKDTSEIWEAFTEDPEKTMNACGGHGDQKFLTPFAKHLWKTPDDGIVSYKQHGKEGPVGNIMHFHGNPKMPDAKGWAEERWNKLT